MNDEEWAAMASVGRIVRPHGNRGQVVVAPETDFGAERFRAGARLYTRRDDALQPRRVTASREHDGRWIVGFEDVTTMTAAEALRGLELRIPGGELQPLGPGQYYAHDLVGVRVQTEDGVAVGPVTRVDFGAGEPLLVVAGRTGEQLIPLAEPICRRVDVAAGVIVIDPPEGLLELNAPARRAEARADRSRERSDRDG